MTQQLPIELLELQLAVQNHIEQQNFGQAMDAVTAFVDRILNDPRATTRVLASSHLDQLCRMIAMSGPKPKSTQSVGSGTVIVATEIVAAGGHVELIKDFIALELFDPPVDIVLTDLFGRADRETSNRFAATQGVNVHQVEGANTQERYRAVLELLSELSPSTLVLVVNNQDTIGICSALASAAEQLIFIHHGDHHLCLGVTCNAFQHVDLANIGFNSCRHSLGLQQNVYWPLVLRKDIEPRSCNFNLSAGLTTCAVGRSAKFQGEDYVYDYVGLLPEIMTKTGGRHIHVGDVPQWMRRRFDTVFSEHADLAARLTFINWTPSVAQTLTDEKVDLYLGSFPFGGGKAAIEAMACGLPMLMHVNYRNRMYCGADISYPGAIAWRDVKELLDALSALTPKVLADHARRSRQWFETHHAPAVLVRARAHEDEVCPPLAPHRTEMLFAYLDEMREFSRKLELDLSLDGTKAELIAKMDWQARRIAILEAERSSSSRLFRRYVKVLANKMARKIGLRPAPLDR